MTILGLDEWQANELFESRAATGYPQTPGHARSGAAGISEFMTKYNKQLRETKIQTTLWRWYHLISSGGRRRIV